MLHDAGHMFGLSDSAVTACTLAAIALLLLAVASYAVRRHNRFHCPIPVPLLLIAVSGIAALPGVINPLLTVVARACEGWLVSVAPKADPELIDKLGYDEKPEPGGAEPPLDPQTVWIILISVIIVCLIVLIIHGTVDRRRQLGSCDDDTSTANTLETADCLKDGQ